MTFARSYSSKTRSHANEAQISFLQPRCSRLETELPRKCSREGLVSGFPAAAFLGSSRTHQGGHKELELWKLAGQTVSKERLLISKNLLMY